MAALDFLVELGTEELPPKALKTLSDAFTQGIVEGLAQAGIPHGEVKAYAAPRRLAVLIRQLATAQPDRQVEKRGPATSAPEKAVEGFARSCGATVAELEQVDTGKGIYYIYRSLEQGKASASLLPEIVQTSLDKLPIPKRMRWGASRVEFVRPVQWLVMLLGDEVVPASILGLQAGRHSRGHRFHHPEQVEITQPGAYQQSLRAAYVMADFDERKELIRQQVLTEAAKVQGQAKMDEALLEEVTALNEWPVALMGRFEEHFLQVPAEALISTMEGNQKYFPLLDPNGKLLPYFITIANLESKDPAQVIAGNEKVVRPRLTDAAFFFETDKKQPLAASQEKLESIVFQKDLGTLADKSKRVAAVARQLSEQLGGNPDWAERAALLAKCDLVSNMVLEFPELQGLMGYHYALHDGEAEEVALAQNEQYMPRFAGDQLPSSLTGATLAIADRLDTLTGLFGINQPPTGSKDPFALRRAALGVLRILVEKELDVDLRQLLQFAASQHSNLPAADGLADTVLDFMLERFRAWFEDDGIAAEVYLAVLAVRPTRPLDFVRRVKAVNSFRQLAAAESLAAANKRVSNLLSKQEGEGSSEVNPDLLQEAAEKALYAQLQQLATSVQPLFAKADYSAALAELATLREAVDSFFEDVMVMSDDLALRTNRLALLAQLRQLFLQVADISVLNG